MSDSGGDRGRATLKIKLCLAGDYRVGKTSLVRRFVSNTFADEYIATLGAKVASKTFTVPDPSAPEGTRHVAATIWDLMGQKGFREMLQDAFFLNTRGVLFVCDATRPETLESLSSWATSASLVAGPVPGVVLMNKSDLAGDIRIAEADIHDFCKSFGWRWLRTSAKTGEHVEDAFRAIAEEFLRTLSPAALTVR